jgi:hypothetical protein
MSIKVNILTDFNGKGIEAAKKEFAQLETKGQKAAFLIKKAAIPAAAALAGLAVAGKKFVAAGEESNSANQALLSLTQQTGLFGDEADHVAKPIFIVQESGKISRGHRRTIRPGDTGRARHGCGVRR